MFSNAIILPGGAPTIGGLKDHRSGSGDNGSSLESGSQTSSASSRQGIRQTREGVRQTVALLRLTGNNVEGIREQIMLPRVGAYERTSKRNEKDSQQVSLGLFVAI